MLECMPEPTPAPAKRKPASRTMTPEKTETLKKLRASVGQLSTTTMRQLEKSLPWYSRLSSDERSALGHGGAERHRRLRHLV